MSEISPVAVRELLTSRRTIHEFTTAQPPWETIEAALDTARFAPNHFFTQPWRFYRLGRETRQAIVELNAELVAAKRGEAAAQSKRQRWGAIPGWLVITCQRSEKPRQRQEDYAACCCAVQNLMLALWSEGIGSKWTTGDVIRDPRFLPLLGADPEREEVVALLWYGYPAQVPEARRRPLNEVLHHLP